ncbi:MAG: T9SS type A sorting domain-containing protein, partial [Syntrophomonadaceae bacterium]
SPELKLTSPSGGEEITGSIQYTITWTSSNISRISIEYSADNGSSWLAIAQDIPASQGSFVWNVPNDVSSSSCMIRIKDKNSQVFDTVDRVFKITSYAQSISLAGKTFAFASVQKSGYRMIGLPGESSQLKLSQFATGEAKKDWTMYYDNGKDANYYVEYDGSAAFNFGPGKGFWVLSRNTISLTGEVKTVALSAGGIYSITLDHAGWNIISSPFDIAIPWSGVQALNSATENISGFSGSGFVNAQLMSPFEGYYFYNSQNLKTLKLPYRSAVQNSSLQASRLLKNGGSKLAPLTENSIALSLLDQDEVKSQVVMGLNKNSSDDYDSLDAMAPPGDFEEAGMRIIDNKLSTAWKQLFTEYRNAIGEGQKFTIRIKNNTERALKIKWAGVDNFKDYEICLIDKRLNKSYDMRKNEDLTLSSYAKLNECELLIGSSAFIEEESRKLMPQEFSLMQNYPNPFNPATLIRFSLPEDAFVTLRIYDMLGRMVKEAVNGFSAAGFHEVSFDASSIASGVYYYSMEAKELNGTTKFRAAKKMLLIK